MCDTVHKHTIFLSNTILVPGVETVDPAAVYSALAGPLSTELAPSSATHPEVTLPVRGKHSHAHAHSDCC